MCVCACGCVSKWECVNDIGKREVCTPRSTWQPLYSCSHSNSTRSTNENRGSSSEQEEDGGELGLYLDTAELNWLIRTSFSFKKNKHEYCSFVLCHRRYKINSMVEVFFSGYCVFDCNVQFDQQMLPKIHKQRSTENDRINKYIYVHGYQISTALWPLNSWCQ